MRANSVAIQDSSVHLNNLISLYIEQFNSEDFHCLIVSTSLL
jgi:hypothetical protein